MRWCSVSLSLPLKFPGSDFPKCEISRDERYAELWDTKRPKWTLSSSMFGSFCFALLCCFFYKAGEYLCSTSSLQLKYLSAQFGHLKSSTKISMFARLSHRSNISIWNVLSNLEPRKSENCALSTTWSAASALLCSTALKQSLQDAMFFCFVSTAQIFKYAGYI